MRRIGSSFKKYLHRHFRQDKEFKQVFKKRVPNHIDQILETLNPFRDQLKGLVVEAAFKQNPPKDPLSSKNKRSAIPSALKTPCQIEK